MVGTWKALSDEEETYTRPLGVLETSFAWDTIANGVADASSHIRVLIAESDSDVLFSTSNVERAWCALKRLHPLIAATLSERADGSGFYFTVSKRNLNILRPNELAYFSIKSDADAFAYGNKALNAPPTLSNDLLGQLWLMRVSDRDPQAPGSAVWHLIFSMRHCIMDGMAVYNQIRIFLDILTSKEIPLNYIPPQDFKNYLDLHPPIDDLNPYRDSISRLRWRRAIAKVIEQNRTARTKGGHTLPVKSFQHSPQTTLVSASLSFHFDKDTTRRILKNCRKAGITLGHALPVLCQIAHSRITHRLYSEGFISKDEWEFKTKEPMHFGGPINLRPYLHPEWVKSGGKSRGCLAIGSNGFTLPAMPVAHNKSHLGIETNPSYAELMSKPRFFHRCRLAKKQGDMTLKHPLLVEFAEIRRKNLVDRTITVAKQWRHLLNDSSDSPPPAEFVRPFTTSNGCSTVGNLADVIPPIYPLNRERGGPTRLHVQTVRMYLRCRPKEFYLTSITYNGELQLMLFLDISTNDENLAREWLTYVGNGMKWYLGKEDDMEKGAIAKL